MFWPGDLVHWARAGKYQASAEASTPVKAVRIPSKTLRQLAASNAAVEAYCQATAEKEVDDAQSHVSTLTRKTAVAKVSAFILHCMDRNKSSANNQIYLPMRREEIADYLGIAAETVSRCLTQLADNAVLTFDTLHRAVIRNRHALDAIVNGTSTNLTK